MLADIPHMDLLRYPEVFIKQLFFSSCNKCDILKFIYHSQELFWWRKEKEKRERDRKSFDLIFFLPFFETGQNKSCHFFQDFLICEKIFF